MSTKPQNKKPEKEAKEEETEEQKNLTNNDTQTKYRTAADIASQALAVAKKACVAGAKIVDICAAADKHIDETTGKQYNKTVNGKKIEKGVAFPTCVSVNHIVGHFSPLADDAAVLAAGDVVKIDLGVHIDGYIAVTATTVAVPAEGAKALEGRKADVIMAAHTAAEAAVRLIKVGNTNAQVTDAIQKAASQFKCEPVQGVLSHNMSRYLIDGERVIIGKQDVDHKVDLVTFENNEVYAVDIVMTTGEGKPKEAPARTTVYKRVPDATYMLKMKASREIFGAINKNHPTFPFTIRSLEEKTVRFGIVECHKHELVQAYPVLMEKESETVAHVKFTVLLTEAGPIPLAYNKIDLNTVKSEFKVEDAELKQILNQSAGGAGAKKKKNKKKKPKKEGDKGGDDAEEEDGEDE